MSSGGDTNGTKGQVEQKGALSTPHKSEESAAHMAAMLTLYVHDAMENVGVWARNVMSATVEGDELRTMLGGPRRLTKHDPVNRTQLHDVIAEKVIAADGWTVG